MKQFFLNQNIGNNYAFLEVNYFVSLALIIVICTIIILSRNKLVKISQSKKNIIRLIFGCFLLIAWFLRRGSFILYGVYNWRHHLDINFCSMTNIMMILYCFTGNKRLYRLCYYLVFCGPFLSILYPSINSSLFNYSTINFLIIHHCIFIFNLIFFFFESPKYNKKDLIISEGFIVSFVLVTYVYNWLFKTNYNTLQSFVANNEVVVPFENSIAVLLIVNICCIIFAKFVFKKLELRG